MWPLGECGPVGRGPSLPLLSASSLSLLQHEHLMALGCLVVTPAGVPFPPCESPTEWLGENNSHVHCCRVEVLPPESLVSLSVNGFSLRTGSGAETGPPGETEAGQARGLSKCWEQRPHQPELGRGDGPSGVS